MKKFLFINTLLFAFTDIQAACTITANSIADIRLGQTLANVKHRLPRAKFTQERDAEGAELTMIQVNPNVAVWVHLDDGGKIDFLQTDSAACQTRDGVHPNMLLRDVAKKWGSLKHIQMSEIEMRQFAEFNKQPEWLTIQTEGGDFGRLDEINFPLYTRTFAPDARVSNISIAQ